MRVIDAMHKAFGYGNGFCGQCKHFMRIKPTGKIYFKCQAYGDTSSEAADWRAKWVACGLYNKSLPVPLIALIETLKHEPRKQPDKPLEGQLELKMEYATGEYKAWEQKEDEP